MATKENKKEDFENQKQAAQLAILEKLRNPDFYREGKITLAKPFVIGEREITELEFDFSKMTGLDYVNAMDVDRAAVGNNKASRKQIVSLFAASLKTPGIDYKDLMNFLGPNDMMTVLQVGELYFMGANFRTNMSLETR